VSGGITDDKFAAAKRRDSGVGTRLRALRSQKGFTQAQVAERMHVHVTAIRHLERGATDPGITRVLRYCEAIGARLHIGLREPQ
jgi:transcriptional regulator with XRE-family HTH domain